MTFHDSQYSLADCARQHAAHPRSFEVPSPLEIERLKPGDVVKLIFEFPERHETGMVAERMWVRISSVLPGTRFTAELDNEPFVLGVGLGHWVEFEARHIADIYPADDRHLWERVADNRRWLREKGHAGYEIRACGRCGVGEESDPTVIRERESQAVLCDGCSLLADISAGGTS